MNNKFRERLIKILKEATKQPGVVESLIKILNEITNEKEVLYEL